MPMPSLFLNMSLGAGIGEVQIGQEVSSRYPLKLPNTDGCLFCFSMDIEIFRLVYVYRLCSLLEECDE